MKYASLLLIFSFCCVPHYAFPQSITAPNNSGIITQGQLGSNYLVQKLPPRKLDAGFQAKLLQMTPKDKKVKVEILNGVEDAYDFANEIIEFLSKSGYNVDREIDTDFIAGPQPHGTVVYNQDPKMTRIVVGISG